MKKSMKRAISLLFIGCATTFFTFAQDAKSETAKNTGEAAAEVRTLTLDESDYTPTYSSNTKAGVASGMIAGAVVLTFLYVTHSPLNGVIHFGFAGLIVNVVVAVIVTAFTKKPSVEKVWQFHGYLRYKLSPEEPIEVCGRSTADFAN